MKKLMYLIIILVFALDVSTSCGGEINPTAQAGVAAATSMPNHGHSGAGDGGILITPSCNVYTNGVGATTGAAVMVTWENVIYDPLHLNNAGANTRFTVPASGGYNWAFLECNMTFSCTNASENQCELQVYKNGVAMAINYKRFYYPKSATSFSSQTFNVPYIPVTANDYIEVNLHNSGTTTVNIMGTYSTCTMQLYR